LRSAPRRQGATAEPEASAAAHGLAGDHRGSPSAPRQPRQPPRHSYKCTTPSGASPSGPASCARPTGRATPTNIGRLDPPPMPRPSDREVDNVRRARPCLRRNDYTETRSAILVDLGDIALPHQQGVIRTRDEPPRTTGGGGAPKVLRDSKLRNFVIDPSPPRRCGGRSGTR
jgi:hypothetical protein